MSNNHLKKCIFIGNFFSDKMIQKYSKYTSLSIGNDNYEKNFIKVLEGVFDNLVCLSTPALPRASFKFPFLFIKKHIEKLGKMDIYYIPFLNSRFACTKERNVFKEVDKHLLADGLNYVFISTYHHVGLVKKIKMKYPNTCVAFLLPDLPNISVSNQSFFTKQYMKRINKSFFDSLQFIDLLLPITSKQLEQLPNYKNDYMVYETYFDVGVFDSIKVEKKKQILYAGSLNKSYGILELISQFESNDNTNYQLVICGKGDCEKDIIESSINCEKIVFLGFVPKEKVYELEKESMLIVCPDKEHRPYSFHSRYLEYLASGTPVLTFCPEGSKEEYLRFFNLIEEYGGNLSTAIEKVLFFDYDKALKKAHEAALYIRDNKTRNSFSKKLSEKISFLKIK